MITLKPVETVNLTSAGLGPWSHSKLKMLTKCPLQFYLKYIAKAKVTAETPISIVTETGKAAHRILELVIMGKSIDDAYKVVRKEYATLLSDDAWYNGDGHEAGGVGRAEYSITRFKERMDAFEKANPVKRYIPELRIGVTKDWEPTGFFGEDVYFRGVIDLIIQLENGDVLFLDHKFGPPAAMGTRNFQDQLDTYKVLFSKGIEPYGDGQSGVHFIRDGEIVMGTMSSKKDIEETLQNRVEFSIKGAVDKVIELGFFKHIAGSHCQWCDFAPLCKVGELKAIELGTKKWFEIKSI
jgi:hypothetical protein